MLFVVAGPMKYVLGSYSIARAFLHSFHLDSILPMASAQGMRQAPRDELEMFVELNIVAEAQKEIIWK